MKDCRQDASPGSEVHLGELAKLASKIEPGDRVITDSGEVKRVERVSPGFAHDHVILDWAKGWSSVPRNRMLVIAPQTHQHED